MSHENYEVDEDDIWGDAVSQGLARGTGSAGNPGYGERGNDEVDTTQHGFALGDDEDDDNDHRESLGQTRDPTQRS